MLIKGQQTANTFMLRVDTEEDAAGVDIAMSLDIDRLPSLPMAERRSLPAVVAVYFVTLNQRIVYIGATKNLRHRWVQHGRGLEAHHRLLIHWLVVDLSVLGSVERAMIHEFAPRLNAHHTEVGRGARMHFWARGNRKGVQVNEVLSGYSAVTPTGSG